MSVKITFGKYSGYTAKEVAIADAGYAAWAASNLKSDFWRKEFNVGIAAAKTATVAEVVAATIGDDAPESAKAAVRRDVEREQAGQQAIETIISDYAGKMNVSATKLAGIIRGWMSKDVDASHIDPAKFSSRAMYENAVACLNACYEQERKDYFS